MDLKVASLNVRGLGNKEKRRETFNWLRSKRFSIYLLQEHTVQITLCNNGRLNGVIRPPSAVVQVIKQGLVYYLIEN